MSKFILFLFLFLLLPSPALASSKLTIHTGSYSIDYHTLTQAQINSMVQAITSAIPNTTYIAIGTYLDYPAQIRMWSKAIHTKGKKVFFRSAGFNSWQGTNGVAATGTVDQHRRDVVTFVKANPDIFKSGDIFEVVPDEPENGAYWYTTFGTSGIGTNTESISQFNGFIQLTIEDVNRAFSQLGITGVSTNYVFTNPSASKDIVNATTASMLATIGTDNYPENGATTSAQMGQRMTDELTTWVLPAQGTLKPKHITFGPSIYTNLDPQLQADAYQAELTAIKNTLPVLNGVTIWQAGAPYNPNSRLFDYVNNTWQPRPATSVINANFSLLPLILK